MITKEQYDQAVEQEKEAKEIIQAYHKEQSEAFEKRLVENPIFTDDELTYSATTLCPCGHGLAYPKACGIHYHWDCSAILKGIADKNIEHTSQLPFVYYDIKGESEYRGTTRGVFKLKKDDEK